MCKAFSCIISKKKKVTWKLNKQSHHELIDLAGYCDTEDCKNFVRVEIAPRNENYLNPDKWIFKIDEEERPRWFSPAHEQACWDAFKIYEKELYKIVIKGKKIIHPFSDIKAVKKKGITKIQIKLLKKWDSVRDSVRSSVVDSVGNSVGSSVVDSVWSSVRDSVGDSVGNSVVDSVWSSVGDSVRDSVGDSVGSSVGDSVWSSVGSSVGSYTSSFFKLNKWKYIKHKQGEYPFQSVVDLWEQGLVPSFDGEYWRLHSGKKAKIVFEISQKELKKWKA